MLKYLNILSLLLVATPAQALQVSDLALNYYKYVPGSRTALVGAPTDQVALDLMLNIAGPLYLQSDIHGMSDGQFRAIGWQYELGVHVTHVLDVGFYHHSQHLLDQVGVTPNPVEDALHVRLDLLQQRKLTIF